MDAPSFPSCVGLPCLGLFVTLICATVDPARASTSAIVPIEIDLRARSMGQGEVVRIDAFSPLPLASLRGSFLGRSVFFARSGDGGPPPAGVERWSGWAAIGLLDPPGLTILEVEGRDRTGSPVAGTRAVTIENRPFPEERVTVEPKFVNPPPAVQARIDRERRRLAQIYALRSSNARPPEPFAPPVAGPPTSVFGTRRMFNGQARDPHSGLDLRADEGTPVHCSGAGLVVLALDLYYSGNTIVVDHGGGLFTVYAHLQSLRAREGQAVATGQVIGLSGATGRVTGPHLHWGAKVGDVPVDPRALLDPVLFSSPTP